MSYTFRILPLVLFTGLFLAGCKQGSRQQDGIDSSGTAASVVKSERFQSLYSGSFDFESGEGLEAAYSLTQDKAYQGSWSAAVKAADEYGVTVRYRMKDILAPGDRLQRVTIAFSLYTEAPLKDLKWVTTMDDSTGKNVLWVGTPVDVTLKEWKEVEFDIEIPAEAASPENIFKTYPWNPGKCSFYIDNLRIRFSGTREVTEFISGRKPTNFFYDFDHIEGPPGKTLSMEQAHSGKYSCKVASGEYSMTFSKKAEEVMNDSIRSISISAWFFPERTGGDVNLVAAVKRDDKQIFWEGKSSLKMNLKEKSWNKVNARFKLNQVGILPGDVIEVYAWNKSGPAVFADDFEIVYGDPAERSGTPTVIDMNKAGTAGVLPARNTPPFPVSHFNKLPVLTGNSLRLIPGSADSEIQPDDQFVAGRFLSSATDQLLRFGKSGLQVYAVCEGSKWVESLRIALPEGWSNEGTVHCGDLDGDGRVEMIHISREISIGFFGNESPCSGKATMRATSSAKKTAAGAAYLLADLDGDRRCELLEVDKQGNWSVHQWNRNEWRQTGAGNDAMFKSVSALHSIRNAAGRPGHWIVCGTGRGEPSFFITAWNPSAGKFKFTEAAKSESGSFKEHDRIWQYDASDEIFALDQTGHFNLRRIRKDEKGFYVSSTFDFNGYDYDHNPKYYEQLQVVKGSFTSSGKMELFVVYFNCADQGFDGKRCKSMENIQDLPNGAALYQLNDR